MADNSIQSLTSADMMLMLPEVGEYQIALKGVSQALRAAIDADEATFKDVSGINIKGFDWPIASVEIEAEAMPVP